MAEATTDPVRFPPGPRVPKAIQGIGFVTARQKWMAKAGKRFGPAVTLNLPLFGKAVVISDPALIKDLFTTNPGLLGLESNLGAVLGPGSSFSLNGEEHRQRRKLLVPPFHGKRMTNYEQLIEEETLREISGWADGAEFGTLEPMMRITLNAILRAVFGAQGQALDDLRELLPPAVLLGSRMAVVPAPLRRDVGPWSPGGRLVRFRRSFDGIVQTLVDDARADPKLDRTHRRAVTPGAGVLRRRIAHHVGTPRRRAVDPAWSPGTRPPRPPWHGPSNVFVVTPMPSPGSRPRSTPGSPSSCRPRSGRCSGPVPSSTRPSAVLDNGFDWVTG